MLMTPTSILWGVGILMAAAAAWFDFRTRNIPNPLVFGGLALAVLVALFGGAWVGGASGLIGLLSKVLLGFGVCAVLPLILWFRGVLGGGDVKLLAALGATFGPFHGLQIELWGFVAAAVVTLVSKIAGGRGLHEEPLNDESTNAVFEPDSATRPPRSHSAAEEVTPLAQDDAAGSSHHNATPPQYLVFAPPLFAAVVIYCAVYWPF